jgi:hypothetical protein
MKIRTIVIELEPEDEKETKHASRLEFKNEMWTTNGPVFPRIAQAMRDIVRSLIGNRRMG